ncbi:MAG: hypothetical protein IIX13_03410 [Bacteroidales bacterium]|nr:hypothetical protein [Bacteroidales bacterium]
MKRVCRRKIQIDAMTVCFEVIDRYHYDQITELDFGQIYDLYEFQLIRTEGRYYNNVYAIIYMDGDCQTEFGQLKFNIGKVANPSNLHDNGNLYLNYYMLDEVLLEDMFFYHLNSVIRFKCNKEKILWEHLLGRVA